MSDQSSYHADNWINHNAGLGGAKDKSVQGFFARDFNLPDEQLSALYYGNAIANKIVYKIPELIHQAGYTLESKKAPELTKLAQHIELDAKVLEAHWQARLFGAAAVVPIVNDGLPPTEPLDFSKIKSINGANVIDRRFMRVAVRQSDPLKPGLGEPEIVEITPHGIAEGVSMPGVKIHVSRMLLFYGQRVDKKELPMAYGWGYSILKTVFQSLRNSDSAMASLGAMLLEASVSVFRVQNLIAQLTSNNRDVFLERMRITNEQKSTLNSVMVDAEKEDYTRVAAQFSGVAENIDRVFQYVAAAADYPMTILFGISPGGMNATGESDTEQFYNRVGSVRKDQIEPQLRRAYEILAAGIGAPGEPFKIIPGPIKVTTPAQEIAYRKSVAEVDALYIANDVVPPEAVTLARYENGYNPTAPYPINVLELKAAIAPAEIVVEGKALELTPSDIANVVLVWEARESVGKGPLLLPDGTRNPDNDMTVAAFKAKNEGADPALAPEAPEVPADGQPQA